MNSKRVTVGPTPGKTKHFQTHNIDNDLTLVDCPGLVFPSVTHDRAELILAGVMPIDQIRTHLQLMETLDQMVRRVGRDQLRRIYGLTFPQDRTITGTDVAISHARMRGFTKDHGRPDDSRSARILLKDFINGKLLHCKLPPGMTSNDDDEQPSHYNSQAVPDDDKKGHAAVMKALVADDEDDLAVALSSAPRDVAKQSKHKTQRRQRQQRSQGESSAKTLGNSAAAALRMGHHVG